MGTLAEAKDGPISWGRELGFGPIRLSILLIRLPFWRFREPPHALIIRKSSNRFSHKLSPRPPNGSSSASDI